MDMDTRPNTPARTENILVLNCGSSSVKAAAYSAAANGALSLRMSALVERVNDAPVMTLTASGAAPSRTKLERTGHAACLEVLLPALTDAVGPVTAVGHRVAHGADRFDGPVRVDAHVRDTIVGLCKLAPLHNPANLAGIDAAAALLPDTEQVAVFDNAFHATLPAAARTYGLPLDLARAHDVVRCGFHGTSHGFVAQRLGKHLGSLPDRVVTCHLGNGASLAAVLRGKCRQTTMGLTPLAGLVMGTRVGDIDPGALLHLQREAHMGVDELDTLLNKKSGLLGISGLSNDVRDLEKAAADGHPRAALALEVFAERFRGALGQMAFSMGGLDAIVFTAGIGENATALRLRLLTGMEALGITMDVESNAAASDKDAPVTRISAERSAVQVYVAATDEQHSIAAQALHVAQSGDDTVLAPPSEQSVVQLTPADRAVLGEPEVVALHGPAGTRASIPVMPGAQSCAALSARDAFLLGLAGPGAQDADIAGTVTVQAAEHTLRLAVRAP